MKRIIFLTLLLLFATNISGAAWISAPDRGDTGWRTYTYHASPAGFTGTAGFVVSNVIDNSAYSELLLDNLSQGGGAANRGFEIGNYSGYSFLGNSAAEVSASVTSYLGNVYNALQGDYFSHQQGLGTGIATSAFRNASLQAGTTGSILETAVSLPSGSSFTFDWAFLAGDLSPWNDFALFYLKDSQGNIVFSDGLAQIGTIPTSVPLPPGILLLGSGLLGLWGWRRRAGWQRNGDR
ncbi:MAG: hypothetical protein NTW80_02535 [Deltaproteobacteria bacterium]|nr:hypothetical protein [Deltaproteobacteria bacterium]